MLIARAYRDRFVDSVKPSCRNELLNLQRRMQKYYRRPEYHSQWVKGANANWSEGSHDAQIRMCTRIPNAADVLEVGCGDGACAAEIALRAPGVRYLGMDVNPEAWRETAGFTFVPGSADAIPFANESFDVVLSMFVIEHLVFPALFLDEAWRVLRPGGRLLVVAPDFRDHGMASQRTGWSYGSGRDKLRRGRIVDALMSAFDSRIRIGWWQRRRRRSLQRGRYRFPVLLNPLCLSRAAFVPDCDAVYPVCPEEISNYMQEKPRVAAHETFYRDKYCFGWMIAKAPALQRDHVA